MQFECNICGKTIETQQDLEGRPCDCGTGTWVEYIDLVDDEGFTARAHYDYEGDAPRVEAESKKRKNQRMK